MPCTLDKDEWLNGFAVIEWTKARVRSALSKKKDVSLPGLSLSRPVALVPHQQVGARADGIPARACRCHATAGRRRAVGGQRCAPAEQPRADSGRPPDATPRHGPGQRAPRPE